MSRIWQSWHNSFRVYKNRQLVFVLVMGFVSGLPLYLVLSTLSIWLTEAGVALATIGLFSIMGLPWNLKFMWAPLMDAYTIPGLHRLLGRRKSWMFLAQIGLVASVFALSVIDPAGHIWLAAVTALAIAFFSASQDIVIDAYRIAILPANQQGAGAAATQTGYRLSGLVAGAGALFAADAFSWTVSFLVMAAILLLGMTATILAPVPPDEQKNTQHNRGGLWTQMGQALSGPFVEFITRDGWKRAGIILLFVLLYKFGDAFAGVMANPFYVGIGFSKSEIATVSKLFGLVATLLGVAIGGVIVFRWGAMPALIFCGVLQMLSNAMFIVQAEAGAVIGLLFITIAAENLSGGMGSAAFVGYLSLLCAKRFAGTQFALLTSLMAVGRTILASPGGFLAEMVGWSLFFALSMVAALPGLLIALWMMKALPPLTPQHRDHSSSDRP